MGGGVQEGEEDGRGQKDEAQGDMAKEQRAAPGLTEGLSVGTG